MKTKIANFIKYNPAVYAVYFHVLSALLRIVSRFVRTDEKLILFNSFAGRRYDDSPRELYEAMRRDPRFRDFRFVWAFHNPEQYDVPGAEKIKTDTPAYFCIALQARAWITNSSIERGLDFKGRNAFYFNTWHGTPIKRMGTDISAENSSFHPKFGGSIDVMTSQSRFETEIFSRTFGIPKDRFLECGLPRNDILADISDAQRKSLREKLGIPAGKKVILYAPTFREFEKDGSGCVMHPPMDLKLWERELGSDFVLLFRVHYEVAKSMEVPEGAFVRDMTAYPSMNELMAASDLLISDYSSTFFDFSITGRPMLHFTYDYDKYSSLRGMYFDIRQYLSGAADEQMLIRLLKTLDPVRESEKTAAFRNEFVNFYGSAVQQSLDCIASHIGAR